jgi:CBS domain-containing protein
MWAQHVHRLPVLDERGGVTGIITAFDIVGALVNAFED